MLSIAITVCLLIILVTLQLHVQVLNAAWDALIPVSSENDLPCHDRDGYNHILEKAKPLNDPDGRHLTSFTYLRVGLLLMERQNFMEFELFVKRMHGKSTSYYFLMFPVETLFQEICVMFTLTVGSLFLILDHLYYLLVVTISVL